MHIVALYLVLSVGWESGCLHKRDDSTFCAVPKDNIGSAGPFLSCTMREERNHARAGTDDTLMS